MNLRDIAIKTDVDIFRNSEIPECLNEIVNEDKVDHIVKSLVFLAKNNVITEENKLDILISFCQYAYIPDGLLNLMVVLHKQKALTETTIRALLKNPDEFGYIDIFHLPVLGFLIEEKIPIEPSFHFFLQQSNRCMRMTEMLNVLKILQHKKILTENSFIDFCQHLEYTHEIHTAVEILQNENSDQDALSEQNVRLCCQQVEYLKELTDGFEILKEANLLKEHFQIFCEHAKNARSLADGLLFLNNRGILFKENVSVLFNNATNAVSLAKGLHILSVSTLDNPEKFRAILSEHAPYAENLAKGLCLLSEEKVSNLDKKIEIFCQHAEYADQITTGIIEGLQSRELVEKYFDMLCENGKNAATLARGLQTLSQSKAANSEENIRLLCQRARYAEHIAIGILLLIENHLNDKTHIEQLSQNVEYDEYFTSAMQLLNNAGVLKDNFKLLCENAKNADELTRGLRILEKDNISPEDNFRILCEHSNHAASIAKGICVLTEKKIQDKEHFIKMLLKHPRHAENVATGLCILMEEKIADDDNYIENYLNHAEHAETLNEVMTYLKNAGLLKDNFSILCEHAKDAYQLSGALCILNDNGIPLTNQVFRTLCEHAQYARSLAAGYSHLRSKNINDAYIWNVLKKHAKYASQLAPGLCLLAQEKIATPGNIDAFCRHANDPDDFTGALKVLQKKRLLNNEYFNILCQYQYNSYTKNLAYYICHLDGTIVFDRLMKNLTINNNKKIGELLLLLSSAEGWKENTELLNIQPSAESWKKNTELLNIQTTDELFQFIIDSENINQFNEYIKTAAFFMLHREALNAEISSYEKIYPSLSTMKPDYLKDHLKNILNKLGGYSFMPNQENITLGVEIEYTNVPSNFKSLTEFVIHLIQKGWSHPGDSSVEIENPDSYGGEATTGIITNNTDLKSALLNVAFLQAMNATTNESCGLHVHIGVVNMPVPTEYKTHTIKDHEIGRDYTDYQLEFIKQFLLIYQREASKFSPIERLPNTHAKVVTVLDPNDIQTIKSLTDLIKIVQPDSDRYYEINLMSFAKHGTIEVRRFSGSTEEPEIFSTLSMISAMAKEAQARTNQIFDEKLQSKESYQDTFFMRQKTEQESGLFKMRVKEVNETELNIIKSKSEIDILKRYNKVRNNTVYIYVNNANDLEYCYYNKQGIEKSGTIHNNERFKTIIPKIKYSQPLESHETIQLCNEIAMKGNALTSHPVEKLKQLDRHSNLFSSILGKKEEKSQNKNQVKIHITHSKK